MNHGDVMRGEFECNTAGRGIKPHQSITTHRDREREREREGEAVVMTAA